MASQIEGVFGATKPRDTLSSKVDSQHMKLNQGQTEGFLDSWDSELLLLPQDRRDVYFSEAYQKLYEDETVRARCFIYCEGADSFLLPLLVRPWLYRGEQWFDAESAYGYGGPVSSTDDVGFLERAASAFARTAKSERIFCVFVRFHPLLANQRWLPLRSEWLSFEDRSTVAVDLSRGPESIWNDELHSKHRNVIRKARDNGLVVRFDEDWEGLPVFMDLYTRTMGRLGAAEMYYFDEDYYRKWQSSLSKRSTLVFVEHDAKPIASCILFWGELWGHYHLSASEPETLGLYPNNLMLYEAALYLERKGLKAFHLGGGTSGDPENTLFKFKRRFSASEQSFWLGKLVTIPETYEAVKAEWAAAHPETAETQGRLLQCYRLQEDAK